MTANNEGPPPKVPTPYDLWQETGDGSSLLHPTRMNSFGR